MQGRPAPAPFTSGDYGRNVDLDQGCGDWRSEPVAERVFINGVNGVTGEYLVPPIEPGQVASLAKGDETDPALVAWLRSIWRTLSEEHLGLPPGVDPADVTQAGWAVVFHRDESPEVRDALEPLIEHRFATVGDERTKVLEYESEESWREWLGRYGTAPGSVQPSKVPYYVLLVGPPSRIPYAFQYLLDVEYGVGRVSFTDPQQYERYANGVVDYETRDAEHAAKAITLFGTRHPGDGATRLSADQLVKPLEDLVGSDESGLATKYGYDKRAVIGDGATKNELKRILRGDGAPPTRLLFTASHGMGGWPPDDPNQVLKQGALLCQDWPGAGGISEDHFFAGSDVPDDADVHGLIAFHFACYSAGTPEWDDYLSQGATPQRIAMEPFVAWLPQSLLAHERGGALAVIGHIERAWGYSIATPDAGPQLQPFSNAIERLLMGEPVGYATKDFNERYAALSTDLASSLNKVGDGKQIPDDELASLWVERNDAQNYAIVGDPAVHLPSGAA
jgi:Peptidase family C25